MEADGALQIRRAFAGESLDRVAALQNRTFTSPWSVESLAWELRETDVARLYLIERASGERGPLIGYCSCWVIFDELHINSLAVDPNQRRLGQARRLLRYVFADVIGEGARLATLEVRRSNEAAQALYAGLGFEVEAVRPNYYQRPQEDALVLWHRRLAEAAR